MSPKLDLSWLESREAYRAKMFALFDRRLRGGAAVQRGADDAASHLLGGSRDLVAWPEDIGLFAALTGQRAAGARASGSLEGAIASLLGTYGPQVSYYSNRYPELAGRVPQTRLLALALTDTFARVAVETFSEMADRYDVYLHAGVNMARDWRVVRDPDKVAQLRDPFEPQRDYAYEATTPDPVNMALVFGPDGKLISKQVKTYLTPVELGPSEEQMGLDLVPGAVSDGLGAVRTPVGTLGFVTSKDAWMPDVMQKLDQRHVDLLVQPEFFVGSSVVPEGMWNPDVLLASGYMDVLRHPSIETLVLPELVGNVFSFTADHQQVIAVKPRGSRAAGQMVGQPAHRGMLSVSPWVVPDPARPGEPFPERRRRLGEAGRKMMPGSGVACPDPAVPGPCENGQVEGVLWRDVQVDRRPRYRLFRGRRARTRFSPARPVRRARAPQRNAAVAMRGRRGVVAFEERRRGRDQILLARTRNGGRTWSRAVRPTGRPRGATDEWWPAVAMGAKGRVTVAWVDRSSGRERVYLARSRDGGRRFGPPRALDGAPPAGVAQWRPALAQARGDLVHAAWVDERSRSADGGLPQAGLFYARVRGGVPEAGRRLDGGTPVPLAAKMDNAWAPSVAARGSRVLVSWLDFRGYDWDVFARISADDGGAFGAATPVNDTPAADEALNDTPRALITSGGPLVAWTDWRKRDSSARDPHQAYDTFLAAPGARNLQVDPHAGRQVSTFSPAACAMGRDALVAFQDASRGQNDVRIARMRRGSRRGRAHRVDDMGSRGVNAWRPQVSCSAGRVLAAWEDERDGPPQVYASVARASRLR